MPYGDVGLAVITLTLVVKLALMPLSKKALQSQIKMKALEPELKRIKEQYKDKEPRTDAIGREVVSHLHPSR